MTFSNNCLETIIHGIENYSLHKFDVIIPRLYTGCPKRWIPPFPYPRPPKSRSEIPSCSDLWSQFMKDKFLQDKRVLILVNNRRERKGLPKLAKNVVSLALENAFYHGNQNDPELSVSFKIYLGRNGIVTSITDSGIGFDYLSMISKVEELSKKNIFFDQHPERLSREDRYFYRRGRGFAAYLFNPAVVSFEDQGKTVNIFYQC